MRTRAQIVSLLPLILIAGCHGPGPAVTSSSGTSAPASSSASSASSAPTAPTISASSLAFPSSADEVFATLFAKLHANPPTYHGVAVSRAADPGNDFRLEVWMDPPAFRVEISNDGDRRRFILLTQDGKRFGGREPVAREFGMMDGLTEQAAVLLSPLYIFQPFTPFGCSPARVVGQEIILNRSSVRIRCLATGERHDFWLDDETGLILRIEPVSTSPGKREVWAGSRNSRWIRRSIPGC